MRHYKIYVIDRQNQISQAFDFSGPDDLSALDKAATFPGTHVVEVWQGTRLVARLAEDGQAAHLKSG